MMILRNMIFLILSGVLFMTGCNKGGLTFQIRFQQIDGLKQEDPVLFEKNQIGKVTRITYRKEGIYLVAVAIAENFTHAATRDCRFFISRDPQDANRKAVEMINTSEKGEPIENGATVEGSNRAAILMDQFLGGMKDVFKDLEESLNDMTQPLKKIPNADAIKNLQKELSDLLDTVKQKGASTRKKFEEEILPELHKKIDELRERLKKFGREQEMNPVEETLKDLKKI